MESNLKKSWTKLLLKCGISIYDYRGEVRPADELLDDLYLKLTKKQFLQVMSYYYDYADELFNEQKSKKE